MKIAGETIITLNGKPFVLRDFEWKPRDPDRPPPVVVERDTYFEVTMPGGEVDSIRDIVRALTPTRYWKRRARFRNERWRRRLARRLRIPYWAFREFCHTGVMPGGYTWWP
jgi:hypothetical protein